MKDCLFQKNIARDFRFNSHWPQLTGGFIYTIFFYWHLAANKRNFKKIKMLVIPYFTLQNVYVFHGHYFFLWELFWLMTRIVFIFLIWTETKRLKLNKSVALTIFVINLFLVPFFEKILFIISQTYLHHHTFLVNWFNLGRVFFGTILGLGISILLGSFLLRKKSEIFEYSDVFFSAFVPSIIFYRIGNFLNHSHIGKITNVPWGIEYHGQIRHDISLYEVLSALIISIIIWSLRTKITTPGNLTLITLVLLSSFRVFLDFFRSSDLPESNFHFTNGLTMNQIAYFAVLVICCLILIYKRKRLEASN